MKRISLPIALSLVISLAMPLQVFAAVTDDLSISPNSVIVKSESMEGQVVTIQATVSSSSGQNLLGNVRFRDNTTGKQIGSDQPISVLPHKSDDVFIQWTPTPGTHEIGVQVLPWEPKGDNPANNMTTKIITILPDTDRDGIPNSRDPDDDNDGVPDTQDLYPLNKNESKDTDGDGIADNADPDSDNDGVLNKDDAFPLDPKETLDTDKDGIGDNADPDDDNDGVPDAQEGKLKTNPMIADTDGDGINDKQDPFPIDPKEGLDTDKDGKGNNVDTDDDNDGVPDAQDPFPTSKAPSASFGPRWFANINSPTTFDASSSTDSDGKISKYVWTFDGKEQKEGIKTDYTFKTGGKHAVNLKITDDSGQTTTLERAVYAMDMGMLLQILGLLLIIILAIIITFKYTTRAKKPLMAKKKAKRTKK